VVVVIVKIEQVLGKLEETPYEPMKEEHDETTSGKSTTYRQLHVLNETPINFFGKGTSCKAGPNTTFFATTNNCCQLCRLEEHIASTCLKLAYTMPKCAKCRSGHKTDDCGLKCSLCFGLRHTKDKCWKKSTKGLSTTTNFLEVLVNDGKATLLKLNCIYGGDQHIFSEVKVPKRRLPIITNSVEEREENAKRKHRGANMGVEAVVKYMI
jgi:hypothetical protein